MNTKSELASKLKDVLSKMSQEEFDKEWSKVTSLNLESLSFEETTGQSAVIFIRDWVRTNGDMSEDGLSITYSCKDIETIIEQAKQMENKEHEKIYNHAFNYGCEFSRIEISDEEIEKAKEYHWSYRNGFVEGAKWYREQLKNK